MTFWDKMNHDPNQKPSYDNPIWLDPKTFRDMLRLSSVEPAKQISDQIADVAATLKSYNNEHDGVWVYTVPGDEERQRRAQGERTQTEAHDRTLRELTRNEPANQDRRRV